MCLILLNTGARHYVLSPKFETTISLLLTTSRRKRMLLLVTRRIEGFYAGEGE
jgi:hypothetical protein